MSQNEGRILLAIQAFQKGQFRSLKAATDQYDVPYSTTYTRLKGTVARRDVRSPQLKLTQNEESSLEQWIISMDQRGLAPRIDTVRQMANLLLQKRATNRGTCTDQAPNQAPTLQVGKNWVRNYVQRHDSLKS